MNDQQPSHHSFILAPTVPLIFEVLSPRPDVVTMAHLGVFPLLATIACLAFQPALADQKPQYMCPEFWLTQVFTGFGNECGTVNIKDLKGYAPSQILYDIIAEAPLSNDTFFSNGSHVTCLFQDISYALSGATIGFPTGLHFQFPKFESDGGNRFSSVADKTNVLTYVESPVSVSGGRLRGWP